VTTGRTTIQLGSFVVGEVPPPLVFQFVDANDDPIDLTGFTTATFQWSEVIRGQFVSPVIETAIVTIPATGVVTYTWDGDEFDVTGSYAGIFFVNDGTTQYASSTIEWHVCQSIGTPPIV
jgi:hypothetical protein